MEKPFGFLYTFSRQSNKELRRGLSRSPPCFDKSLLSLMSSLSLINVGQDLQTIHCYSCKRVVAIVSALGNE